MTDNFFADEEDTSPVDVSASLASVVCQITVLSVPASERTGILSGFAKRLLSEADVVMAASFSGPLMDMAKREATVKPVSFSTYRHLASDDERDLFDLTTKEIARTALGLEDIRVSGADIGACWALSLRAPIFREYYAVYTLNKILAENTGRLVILLPALGASEYAFIARLMEYQSMGKVVLRGMAGLKKGALKPIDLSPVHAVRQVLARRRTERDFSVAAATTEKMVGLPKAIIGDRPTTADVLFLQLTDNPMFQRNIGMVVDAVKAKGGVPSVLVSNGAAADVYTQKLARDKIFKFNPKVDWDDIDMLDRLSVQIESRVDITALDAVSLSTWTPLFAAHDRAGLRASLKKLLVFQAAVNLMQGWVKPRSLYLTQSPDTSPYGYLAVSAAKKQCNSFYSFSGLLNEDTRSLPFIAPTALLAYGEQDKAVVSARNDRAAEQISVMGTPSYDIIKSENMAHISRDARAELNLPVVGKIIVIMTSRYNPEIENTWLARFLRWAHGEKLICILVKARRAGTEDYKVLETMAAGKKWDLVRFVNDDRVKSVACADIVITDQPEVAVEAVLYDKVMVHMRMKAAPEGNDTLAGGVGFEVSSEAGLRDIINGILMDDDFMPDEMKQNRAAFKSWINADDDGTASDKLAEKLLSKVRIEHAFDNPFTESFILTEREAGRMPVKRANFTL